MPNKDTDLLSIEENKKYGSHRQYSKITWTRRNIKRKEEQPIPAIGSICVFNDCEFYEAYPGSSCSVERIIGVVVGYTRWLVIVQVPMNNKETYETTFRISDIRNGIIRYKKLNALLCDGQFSYDDLDLDEPHSTIKKFMY